MAEQVILAPASTFSVAPTDDIILRWQFSQPYPEVVAGLRGAASRYFVSVSLNVGGTVTVRFSQFQNAFNTLADLSDMFETNGTVQIDAHGESVRFSLEGLDLDNPYTFTPSNGDEVMAFANALDGETNGTVSATVTLRDFVPVAPSFSDSTGDDFEVSVGTAIAAITVPAANGMPTPTYAVHGTLPAGLSFDATTRVISGVPTASATGIITIRATNNRGTADWTVGYTINAPLYLGRSQVARAYLGSKRVNRIYRGDTRVL